MFSFLNRTLELQELDRLNSQGGLVVITGRRRIGKTRLLRHWLQGKGAYTQAIEAQESLQLEQIYQDLKDSLSLPVQPKSWSDFLNLLERVDQRFCLCIDEFPYLAKTSPHLPSLLQKWLDHQNHKNHLIILSGSSVRMLHSLFLDIKAPLYGRANKVFNIKPLEYQIFCKALKLKPHEESTFLKYSLVGGIPKYWEWIEPTESPEKIADQLYFEDSALLQQEPSRLLSDENIHGNIPTSLLEAIGRGSQRPSEIAQRLQLPQSHLSKVFQLLMEVQLVHRETPFGESEKNAKKTLYRILDPVCRFWYHAYSPHRSKWYRYSHAEKEQIVRQNASHVFEQLWRNQYPDCKRYWEPQLEIDGIREAGGRYIVSDVKFTQLSATEKKRVLLNLKNTWEKSALSKKLAPVEFEVVDIELLSKKNL
jgi:uncharacterized protein